MKRLLLNASWTLAGFAVPTAVMAVSVPIYLAFLGLGAYGLVTVSTSLLSLSGLASLGLGEATIKYVAEYGAKGDRLSQSRVAFATLLLYAALGLVTTVVVFFAAGPIGGALSQSGDPAETATAIRIVAAGVLPMMLMGVATGVLEGMQLYRHSQLLIMARSVLGLAVGVTIVALGGDVHELIGSMVAISWLCAALALWLSVRRLEPVPVREWQVLPFLRQALSLGIFTSLISLSTTAIGQLDKLLIGSIAGLEAVGVYGIAQSVASKGMVVVNAATRVLLPFFSATESREDRQVVFLTFLRTWRAGLMLTLFVTGGMLAVAEWLLPVWLGSGVGADVLPVFLVLALVYALQSASSVPYYFQIAGGRARAVFLPVLLGACSMLLGIWFLTPSHGVEGAAAAAFAYPVACLLIPLGAFRYLQQPEATAGPGVPGSFVTPLAVHGLAAGLAYAAGAYLNEMGLADVLTLGLVGVLYLVLAGTGYVMGIGWTRNPYFRILREVWRTVRTPRTTGLPNSS